MRGAEGRGVEPVVGGGDEGIGIESVSYTHLRAHETVLDLVCRLLLEKKTELHGCHRDSRHPGHTLI